MLVREFCVVNGKFSNLQYLMNSLVKIHNAKKMISMKKATIFWSPGGKS